jgi:tetrahydromethanopterin S-methyltransferase subunit G
MQKMIDNAITVLLGLVIGSLFFFVVQAKAEPPNMYEERSRPSPHQESSVATALDDIVGIFLKNGLSGAIIVCLGLWTFRTDKLNRSMQKENFDKLAEISVDCSSHMASVSTRLENLEREVEQSKAIEMLASRKG